MKRIQLLLRTLLLLVAVTASAGDFDGSTPLICAPVMAIDCVRGEECWSGLPENVGAPSFLRLDFANRAVAGTRLTSPMLLLDKSDEQVLMQGREAGFGWTIALDANGEMTVTLASRDGAYVLFGSCTPL